MRYEAARAGAEGHGRSAAAAVEESLDTIAQRESVVRAWAHLDEERARREASDEPQGPLRGLTLGVKDIFDTADQPTEYGSPIYSGHRPASDAAVVAQLRRAGAVVLGKTHTAELAWSAPAPTTNPLRATHTPGGSSSGSAAAVAAGMVDLAVGTQTAGSVIRPASFCGVLGLKPTFGLLATSGVKQAAPSLDTVGLFACDLQVLDVALEALAPGATRVDATDGAPTRFALARTELWERADDDCKAVVEDAAGRLGAASHSMPEDFLGLADAAAQIQLFEGARSLAWERRAHPELLSEQLTEALERGERIGFDTYSEIRRRALHSRGPKSLDVLFGPADVLVTPASVGEAPLGLASTGDPVFNRLWTLLGCPAISVPGQRGATGLPIGVQLVARPFCEGLLLRAAGTLASGLQGL